MKKLIELAIKRNELENNYGHISCYDAPKQYEEMEQLNSEIYEGLQKLADYKQSITLEGVKEVFENIVAEFEKEFYNLETTDIQTYSFDSFIDHQVLELAGFTQQSQIDTFNRAFLYMNIDDRKGMIEKEYINGEEHTYSSDDMSFIVILSDNE
ncbi:hypothetical protein [Priestia megaterium]|uniref:hypothetical protein n=1 Tax=Priestia megaterium TaxID=1404 RepID=UPI000BFCEE75|nr:hypothetical protein [Priestia megaterium]PGO60675.1 hypothetical protein CN981_08990 [Priestia megaterium]